MKKTLLLLALASLALPASARLVGLYTFDHADPFESTVGAPALEGVIPSNNNAPALSATPGTISLVTDTDVLGTRRGVVSVPSKSTLAIPNPGLRKNWTIVLPFYCPANAGWRCFFQFNLANNGDGSLFIRNNTDIGAGSYTGVGNVVGAWHQLVVSCTNGTATVWCDAKKLDQTRSWTLPGNGLLYFSLDNDGEDSTMYLDDIRLYDETAPAEVFPDGLSEGPAILDPFEEEPYTDDFAAFSRTPDEIVDDPPYRTYVFRRHGSVSFTPVKKRDGGSVLLVGGGGAGGLLRGGGGGGGAVVCGTNVTFLAQTYTATVAAGGIPDIHPKWWLGTDLNQIRPGPSTAATCGGTTTLADFGGTILFSAPGGGGGGNFNYSGSNIPAEGYGLDGASGGGAAGKSTQPGLGTDGLGHDGGEAATDGDNSGGGGGGAGGPGTKGSNSVAGAGGPGVTNSITGTAVVYGGGGGGSSYNLAGGRGGEGGGGNGGASNAHGMRDTACSGVDGLGGGGGGGSGRDNAPKSTMGGRGGDGAVVIRTFLVSDDDPEPALALSATEVGYTNATFDVRLLSLGSGAGSASVVFRLSANADMSDPFFETNVASAVSAVPVSFAPAWAPFLTNTTYYAQATASNDLGVAGTSALVAFTTLEPQPATLSLVPAGVGFGSVSATVSLGSFGAGSDSADLYLDCSFAGDFSDTVSSAATHVASLPFSATLTTAGLEPGSNYYYRVRAVNAWGVEGFTDVWQATTEADPVRLSSIGATPAADGSQTLSVSTLAVEPGTAYSLTFAVDGATVATFTGQTATRTFVASYSGTPNSSHAVVVTVSALYLDQTYSQSARLPFSIGGNNVVVSDWSAHCSAATAIRIHAGDTIVLPSLAWGWRYRILNERFLRMEGLVVTALEPAVAGIEVWNGGNLMGTVAVLVLPEAVGRGDVYVYKETVDTGDRIWDRPAAWDKVGSAENDDWPKDPDDIAVIPVYDTTGTFYLRHQSDLSLGGILFGNFRDVTAECILERHKTVGTKTITFKRTDDGVAFVKVTPNTTSERSDTLKFGGYDILVDCASSVLADSCSCTTNDTLNRGFIKYSACTVDIPEGKYWAVDGIPGYYINMGPTIGSPKLTGEGTFWKKGMGGVTFENASLTFEGTLLDTSHGHLGGFNRAGPIYWKAGVGTNVSVTVAGWVYPHLGNPSESSKGYGWFRTGWQHGYGDPSPHPGVPWTPQKTMTMRGGIYTAYAAQRGEWGYGVHDVRLFEKLVLGPGMAYVKENEESNSNGNPVNHIEWSSLEHEDKGTLAIYDPSRRYVAATTTSTNAVTYIKNHDAFLVGEGVDGDCLVSDVYPIIPWIVAPTSTDDSSWRNTLFASFDAEGRLSRPVWNNTALDGAASPFSNAYLWDKTIEIGRDVTVNSLFMNNGGKNKFLGEGRTLTITSGGLVLHGNNTAIGQPGNADNGSLVLGDADHPGYVFAKSSNASSPNQIWADVTAPGGFVSSWSGALVLGGSQTNIADELVVNAGVLTLGTADRGCSLANNLPVRVCSGATLVAPRADAVKRNLLWFDGADGQFGRIELPDGVAAQCKKAWWRDYPTEPEWQSLPRGTYGSSESCVQGEFVRDDLFTGTGTLRVVADDRIPPSLMILR